MVGQLAYCLMPSRMSGFSSTLTLKKSLTPQAFSACTVSAENPHCGNCGVPFMYSTRGLPVTCCLILSWVSIGWILDLSAGDTRDARKVGPTAHQFEPMALKQFPHDGVLPLAVLHEQPAARIQMP